MKIGLMTVFLIGFLLQEVSYWSVMSDVEFRIRKSDQGYEIPYPVFGSKVLALNGEKVVLKGYIIPLEEFKDQSYFMFSSLPYSNCFFCGGAGPETVVEVYTDSKIPFTNKLISIEGVLELNEEDPDHHMYILRQAKRLNQ